MLRTWLAIPAAALACATVAATTGQGAAELLACAALGAAIAGAVRAFAGASLGAAIAAAAAAMLGALGSIALGAPPLRATLAGAAAMFALAELARPMPTSLFARPESERAVATPARSASSLARAAASQPGPLPAFVAAVLAAALDPAYLPLAPLAGVRIARCPGAPRWTLAAPIATALAAVLAIALAHWSLHLDAATLAGDSLGPLAIVAALAGLASARGALAAAALAALALAALALDLRAGAVTAATPIVGALAAGLGLARLAALVRHPVGQACAAATTAFLLLVARAL